MTSGKSVRIDREGGGFRMIVNGFICLRQTPWQWFSKLAHITKYPSHPEPEHCKIWAQIYNICTNKSPISHHFRSFTVIIRGLGYFTNNRTVGAMLNTKLPKGTNTCLYIMMLFVCLQPLCILVTIFYRVDIQAENKDLCCCVFLHCLST